MNLAGKHLHRWRQKADFPQMSFCNYIYRHLVVFRQIASAFCISFIFPTQKLQPCFTLSVNVLLKTTWLWAVTWVTVKIHLSQCWAMQLKLNRTYFRCVLRYFKFPPQLIRKKEQFLSRCVSVYTDWAKCGELLLIRDPVRKRDTHWAESSRTVIGEGQCASRAPWQQLPGAPHSLWLLCLLHTALFKNTYRTYTCPLANYKQEHRPYSLPHMPTYTAASRLAL